MLGPVFACEWLTTARSWRLYALRLLFGLGLLLILWIVAYSEPSWMREGGERSIQQQAEAGRTFSATIIATQLSLMLLIAPATTAGTLCMDKARGTLSHVLVTDLTNSEIILGKLAARVLPALGLILSTLGLVAICTLMAGIDPQVLTGATLVTLGVTILGASLSLAISVWASKTHEVVMASYLLLIGWLVSYPLWLMLANIPRTRTWVSQPPVWFSRTNPYVSLRPGAFPVERHARFLTGCAVISAGLVGLAITRVRTVSIRQMNAPAGARRRGWKLQLRQWPGPSLDANPVLWREWHRGRPSRWTRAIWWIYGLGSLGFTALGAYIMLGNPRSSPGPEIALMPINGFQVALGLLLVSVSAATSLADERARGSLDVHLTTAISTRAIVWGKWWGAYRLVPRLAVLPFSLAVLAAWWLSSVESSPLWRVEATLASVWLGPFLIVGLILSYGAAITSFGLVAATWIHRQDRAVMATVATYMAVSVAWPIAIRMVFWNDNIQGPGAMGASPFMGIAYTGLVMTGRSPHPEEQWDTQIAWACFWILANLTRPRS